MTEAKDSSPPNFSLVYDASVSSHFHSTPNCTGKCEMGKLILPIELRAIGQDIMCLRLPTSSG